MAWVKLHPVDGADVAWINMDGIVEFYWSNTTKSTHLYTNNGDLYEKVNETPEEIMAQASGD